MTTSIEEAWQDIERAWVNNQWRDTDMGLARDLARAVLEECQVIFYGEEYEGEESVAYERHAPLRTRIAKLGALND